MKKPKLIAFLSLISAFGLLTSCVNETQPTVSSSTTSKESTSSDPISSSTSSKVDSSLSSSSSSSSTEEKVDIPVEIATFDSFKVFLEPKIKSLIPASFNHTKSVTNKTGTTVTQTSITRTSKELLVDTYKGTQKTSSYQGIIDDKFIEVTDAFASATVISEGEDAEMTQENALDSINSAVSNELKPLALTQAQLTGAKSYDVTLKDDTFNLAISAYRDNSDVSGYVYTFNLNLDKETLNITSGTIESKYYSQTYDSTTHGPQEGKDPMMSNVDTFTKVTYDIPETDVVNPIFDFTPYFVSEIQGEVSISSMDINYQTHVDNIVVGDTITGVQLTDTTKLLPETAKDEGDLTVTSVIQDETDPCIEKGEWGDLVAIKEGTVKLVVGTVFKPKLKEVEVTIAKGTTASTDKLYVDSIDYSYLDPQTVKHTAVNDETLGTYDQIDILVDSSATILLNLKEGLTFTGSYDADFFVKDVYETEPTGTSIDLFTYDDPSKIVLSITTGETEGNYALGIRGASDNEFNTILVNVVNTLPSDSTAK